MAICGNDAGCRWNGCRLDLPASRSIAAEYTALSEHPFAEHRLALQLSDDDAKKQELAPSVANNLLKFYGPDKIAIEVVAYGPGIALLMADSANRSMVDSFDCARRAFRYLHEYG